MRRAVAKAQKFVDLLLVFGEYKLRLAIVQQVSDFFLQRIAVHAEAHATDGMARDHRRHPVRPVVADEADDIALAEAQRNENRPAIARASRDLRYWVDRRTTAQLVEPPAAVGQVAFATRVTFKREDGRSTTYALVGEDEAELKSGYMAYTAPLARALLGKGVGDVADTPTGEVSILKIEPVTET